MDKSTNNHELPLLIAISSNFFRSQLMANFQDRLFLLEDSMKGTPLGTLAEYLWLVMAKCFLAASIERERKYVDTGKGYSKRFKNILTVIKRE